ncbi:antibiotic biosynthesis monooxygenase [Tsuneonella suprasediminis]|uniref:Antibiotic biosynthesis monooxygenase n=1 Tax=Tsuneonella suprasediminis TaxID=2306996 RepID=A0A419R5U2_9SPHN|nr:antibiotic biosynthesis monooxygenase [Tsuneonella suprasediminis]RJX71283.1 antibiotic biosynthesis monooxygenase [Tsuneonella suprasediminis]
MFLVVFRNRKRVDIDSAAYAADAAAMETMAAQQPGFRSFKSYTAEDGEVVAISEWDSADNARAWGQVSDHRAMQGKGRDRYYASYTLFACDNPHIHEFSQRGRQ